jgi:hypothetical protein
MQRARITIAGTMGLIFTVAVGLAAFRGPNYLASNVVFTLALAIHLAAIVALLTVPGPRRGFWKGFVVCGWGYLILSLGPGLESSMSAHLATTALLDISYQDWLGAPNGPPDLQHQPDFSVTTHKWDLWTQPVPVVSLRFSNSSFYITTPEYFLRIGHSFFSLVFAITGGLLGRHLARNSSGRTGLIGGNGPSPAIDSVTEHP